MKKIKVGGGQVCFILKEKEEEEDEGGVLSRFIVRIKETKYRS